MAAPEYLKRHVQAFAQGKWGETFYGKPPGKTRPGPVDDRRRTGIPRDSKSRSQG